MSEVMTEIFNRNEMEERRRSIRSQATLTEVCLWECIRKKKIRGVRFPLR
jgi:very-short-patch-repair endonuclease